MKELTILSGKGGTGKTSIAAALASLAENAIFCDNDVDAADLHLILQPTIHEKHQFEGAWVAQIQQERCTQCGLCVDTCRFNAIHEVDGSIQVNPFQCEGCRLCERVCPVGAIVSKRSTRNNWFISATRFGTLVHALMAPGEENSGKLVSIIREKSREIAKNQQLSYIINDGPPGIGCTAISSITGTNHVLVVIEPSQSGFHDARRVIHLVAQFKIPVSALINKFDLNPDLSEEIKSWLAEKNIPVLGMLPFDPDFVHAMIAGQTMVEYKPHSMSAILLKESWKKLEAMLVHAPVA